MKSFLANDTNVKLLGRTFLLEDKLWLSLSASGIEFTFEGKNLEVTILGSTASTLPDNRLNYARFAIYVNDSRVINCDLNEPVKIFQVIQEETPVKAVIRILKLSECAMSTMAIAPLSTDEDATITPTPKKERRVEIIGDSITCGYGVDDEDWSHPFVTATEDVTKSYSYRTIQALDADYSIFSTSGHGIISGYTDNPAIQMTEQKVPDYYPYYGLSYDKFGEDIAPTTLPWDFSKFIPDAVIINLGTNDDSFCQDMVERQNDYKVHYIAFLETIRSKYPDATIFCILGLMGDRLYPYVMKAVQEYSAKTEDTNIYSLHIPPQLESDGYVSDYHPTCVSHAKATAVLVPFVKLMMGWEDEVDKASK